LGLTQKNLLFTSALVVALVGSTLAYTTLQANRLAHENLSRAVLETSTIWKTYETNRYATLKRGLSVFANDPAFKAAVQTNEPATVYDLLRERGRDLGADLFVATSRDGKVIARSDNPQEAGADLSGDPVARKPLDGAESAEGVWKQKGRLFQVVSVPMRFGPTLVGILVAGYAVDAALATQMRDVTHCEIAYILEDLGKPQILASSLAAERAQALEVALPGLRTMPPGAPFDLAFGGEAHVAVLIPLLAATGERLGSVLAVRRLAEEMAAYQGFRTSLVLISALVMGIGLALAYVASARITGPLKGLLSLVEKARDGSYSGTVAVTSADEIGALAKNFNDLLKELREKEQSIRFLRGGTNPLPGRAPKPTGTTASITALSMETGIPLEKGKLFAARYEILEALGKGGMGAVYRAQDHQLGDTVALKVIRRDILKDVPGAAERFKAETKLARKITHKNVVRIHDIGEVEGVLYMSMEYVEGVALKDLLLRRGAPPVAVSLRIARQACHGLAAAHAQGIVHRDIKPQNILILPESGDLKIMDFGVAQPIGRGLVGPDMATADYLSPEQALGRDTDFRSDIYSLGVVLFELFTGRLPFEGTEAQVIQAHAETPPPRLRKIVPAVPEKVEAVVLRCLMKLRADRYQSVPELLADLMAASS
jgi:serine/threonine-protein kinase